MCQPPIAIMGDDNTSLLDENEIATLFRTLADERPGNRRKRSGPKQDAAAFRACIGCILSAQSQDRNTAAARDALFELADSPESLLELDDDAIVDAI